MDLLAVQVPTLGGRGRGVGGGAGGGGSAGLVRGAAGAELGGVGGAGALGGDFGEGADLVRLGGGDRGAGFSDLGGARRLDGLRFTTETTERGGGSLEQVRHRQGEGCGFLPLSWPVAQRFLGWTLGVGGLLPPTAATPSPSVPPSASLQGAPFRVGVCPHPFEATVGGLAGRS
jgi:hypothetical protein